MCMRPTSRHFARSTVVPNVPARSSITFQWWASASNPASVIVAPIDSRPTPYRPASRGPVGEATAATATSMCGSGYGGRGGPGVAEPVRRGLDAHRLLPAQEPHDDVEVRVHELARVGRAEADHRRVGRQRAGADAEHRAPAGEVIQEDHALGHPQRVVVCQRRHRGAEPDVARALGGGRDEDLRRGDDLAPGGVVLADPRLVVAEPVEVLDELEVGRERERRVLPRRMEGSHEDAEAHPGHGSDQTGTAGPRLQRVSDDALVGVIANPASGRDIRRLVAGPSVFGNADKAGMVFRLLAGLGAGGVERVLMLPAADGLSTTLHRYLHARHAVPAFATAGPFPELEELDVELEGTARDSTVAVERMVAAGVRAIAGLGGDGPHRVVARDCGDVPLCALSTGTNNAFPEMRETTVAGLATGLRAPRRAGPAALRREVALSVEVPGAAADLALVDVAVSS